MKMKKNERVEEFIADVPVLKHAKVVHPVYVLGVKFVVFQIAAARFAVISLRMLKIRSLVKSWTRLTNSSCWSIL